MRSPTLTLSGTFSSAEPVRATEGHSLCVSFSPIEPVASPTATLSMGSSGGSMGRCRRCLSSFRRIPLAAAERQAIGKNARSTRRRSGGSMDGAMDRSAAAIYPAFRRRRHQNGAALTEPSHFDLRNGRRPTLCVESAQRMTHRLANSALVPTAPSGGPPTHSLCPLAASTASPAVSLFLAPRRPSNRWQSAPPSISWPLRRTAMSVF